MCINTRDILERKGPDIARNESQIPPEKASVETREPQAHEHVEGDVPAQSIGAAAQNMMTVIDVRYKWQPGR